MTEDFDFLAVLALALVVAKLAGQLGQRVGFPTPVGKITAGLIIGPAVLGVTHAEGTLADLSTIGVVLLMFLAGLETDTRTMRSVGTPALAIALGGVVLPFCGGVAVGAAFSLGWIESLFLGALLTATSVSVSAQTLREMGKLQSREGTAILAAAVIDDVLGIAVLSFVFALSSDGDPVMSLARMAVFLPVAIVLGRTVLRPAVSRLSPHLSSETQIAAVIAVALLYAWAAEELGGVAAITGAYLAGLLVGQTELAEHAKKEISAFGYAFFVPLFFLVIGLQGDFGSVGEAPVLVACVIAVAIVAKVIGCYAGGRAAGFSGPESLRVGVGMMSRGEVALVIAAAGLEAGAIDDTLFSASVLMALVTTLLTPVLLRFAYREQATPTGGPRPEPSAPLQHERVHVPGP